MLGNTFMVENVLMLPGRHATTLEELQHCMRAHNGLSRRRACKGSSKVGVLGAKLSLVELYNAFRDEADGASATNWQDVVGGLHRHKCWPLPAGCWLLAADV